MTDLRERFQEGTRVGIVDDVPRDLEETTVTVRDAGFTPVEIPIDDANLSDVVAFVEAEALGGVVVDHRLRQQARVTFDGATLAASFYRDRVPAVLRTTFKLAGDDLSIRRYRRWLPRVLSRGTGGDEVAEALFYCAAEIGGDVERARIGQRSLVEVVDAETDVLDVVVAAWHPHEAVRIPLAVVGLESIESAEDMIGAQFFSAVNVWAAEPDELFFDGMEPAQPAEDDFMR